MANFGMENHWVNLSAWSPFTIQHSVTMIQLHTLMLFLNLLGDQNTRQATYPHHTHTPTHSRLVTTHTPLTAGWSQHTHHSQQAGHNTHTTHSRLVTTHTPLTAGWSQHIHPLTQAGHNTYTHSQQAGSRPSRVHSPVCLQHHNQAPC